MSGIWLTGCAVTISIFLLIIFFSKRSVENTEVKIYKYMIILNFLFSVNALVAYIVAKTMGVELIVGIFQRIHLSLLFALSYLFFIYIVNINNLKEKTTDLLFKGSTTYLVISILLIMFFPIDVINYGEILDVGGMAYYVAIVGVLINFLLVVIFNMRYFIKNPKNIKKNIPFFSLIILFLIGFILRVYYPEAITETYCTSFVFLIMYFTIENPDMRAISELELAREQADKANTAKTDFLSSMSHEIRTPLNAIVGFSGCIESAKSLDEAKENAKDIISASNTLLDIVNGILDISKIESGKLEITNSPYSPIEKLTEVSKLMQSKISEKGLDFQISIAPDLPKTLLGDHANLKKVVSNLLSNAYKYTDHGFVKYDVSCVNNGDTCRLIISVEDSGRGIKKENIDKLFTKFQRLDEDRNTTIEGTGLGLAITKQLVELMGGKIILHTIYGQGSKFTIVLNQKIDFNSNNIFVSYNEYNRDFDLSNKRILVVDDNNLNLKVASKILQKYHAEVVCVDSGFKCIDSINNGDYFDLILMDDMMPKMSGVETLQKLKYIKHFNIPVIALTANAITGMKEKYLDAGFNDYLAKPINNEELKKVLTKVFNTHTVEKKVDFGALPDDLFNIDGKDSNSNINEKISSNIVDVSNDELKSIVTDVNNSELESTIREVCEVLDDDNSNNSLDPVVFLKDNKVDVDHGLSLLGDMEMYNDTMKDFMSEAISRFESIKKHREIGDMTNYAIEVHSLKSDSKYLGFMDLADISYQHELKSKANDIAFVNDNFKQLEDEFNRIFGIVTEYLKRI